jgi:branched-chain amino acid transport system permease protein
MIQFYTAYQSVLDQVLVYALLAMSQHIVLKAGTFSLGSAAFAAIGAYATAILTTRFAWPPALAIGLGALLAMAASAVLALPLSRLRGVFQAVATLALVQVVVTINLNWNEVTRGALGINGIPKAATTVWLALIVVIAGYVLLRMTASSLGRAMDVIREDETVAVSLGIRVAYHQRVAMISSGFIAGLAGGLYACNSYAITAEEFGFGMTVTTLAMVVLGGRASVWGAVTGATVLTTLPELFRFFAEYRNVVEGSLLVLAIVYLPNGMADTLLAKTRDRRLRLCSLPRPAGAPQNTGWAIAMENPRIALELQSVARHFGGVPAVDGIDLKIRPGAITGLIGPNGAGKTTVVNLVMGLLHVSAGRILFDGRPVERLEAADLARAGIARTFQNIRLIPDATVLENVMAGFHADVSTGLLANLVGLPSFRREDARHRACAMALLDRFEMTSLAQHRAASLSYGHQRRTEMMRALAMKPRVLLLDEPVAGMNDVEAARLGEVFREVAAQGVAVLLIEHNMRFVSSICSYLYVLASGRLIAQGEPNDVLRDRVVVEAYLGGA